MKKRILGLTLAVGMILVLGSSAFGAASPYSKPTFNTKSALDVGTVGRFYKVSIDIATKGLDDKTAVYVTSEDGGDYGLNWQVRGGNNSGASNTAVYNMASKDGVVTLYLSGTPKRGSKNGFRFDVFASNDQGTAQRTYILKINGTTPVITTSTDLAEVAAINKNGNDTVKAVVVGQGFTNTDIKGKGTRPVVWSMSGAPSGVTISYDKANNATLEATTSSDITAKLNGSFDKAGKFNIRVTAENKDLGVKTTKAFTLTVLDSPDITTTKLPDATVGTAYRASLAGVGGNADFKLVWGVSASGGSENNLKALPTGLSIDKEGRIFGTISGDVPYFKRYSKDVTFSVPFTAKSGVNGNYVKTKSIDIVVKNIKPEFPSKDQLVILKKISTSEDINNIEVYIKSGGDISVDVSLPEGLSVDTTKLNDRDTRKVVIKGRPKQAAKSASGRIVARSGAGDNTLTLKFEIDAPDVSIDLKSGSLPEGAKPATEAFTKVVLVVSQEPVKWTASNLPKGLTFEVSKDNPRYAEITGAYDTTKEPALDKNGRGIYRITATNTVTKKTATLSRDARIYISPDVSQFDALATKSGLPAITTGKLYKTDIKLKGTGAYIKSIQVNGTDINKASKDVPEGNSLGKFWFISDDKGKNTLYAMVNKMPSDKQFGVKFTATNPANMEIKSKLVSANVKGVAPKFVSSAFPTTPKMTNGTALASPLSIDISGTKPISFEAYISKSDAKKAGLSADASNLDTKGNIKLTFGGDNGDPTIGLKLISGDKADDNTMTQLALSGTPTVSVTNLPITIVAKNAEKSVTKAFKITIDAKGDPKWVSGDKKVSDDFKIEGTAGKPLPGGIVIKASADKPFVITVSQKSGTPKNGITATYVSKDVTISGTPTAGKETKTPITLTITNPTTKKKHTVKVTIEGKLAPIITTKKYGDTDNVAFSKDFEVGKAVNIKLNAKGSKTITWGTASKDTLKNTYGLTFDEKTGTIRGTAALPTSGDVASGVRPFKPIIFTVSASNSAGSSDATVKLGIKGKKPKFVTKVITLKQDGSNIGSADSKLFTDIASGDAKNSVAWSIIDTEKANKIGIGSISSSRNVGILSAATGGLLATKGTPIRFKADNVGSAVTGSVKIVINDPTPSVDKTGDQTIATSPTAKVTTSGTQLKLGSNVTGDTKITWSVTKAPGSGVTAKITANNNDGGKTATLTFSAPKGLKLGTSKDHTVSVDVEIAATNKVTKESGKQKFKLGINTKAVWDTLTANGALPEDEDLDTEEAELTDDEAEDLGEGEEADEAEDSVTIGAERTEASLSAGERAVIEQGGYVIAAILPEITVADDGQYDLEVDLNEAAPEGAELKWFAFPRNTAPSDDDDIVEFYDEAGAEIEAVPANHKVVASPWLDAEVTYAPVIAVKDENAKNAKGSLDDAKEGEVVTEEALEGSAE